MPRQPRVFVPDMPIHVIQRGNNRQMCFFGQGDYHFYLSCLRDACEQHDCRAHAYVLMTNHVHLLLTPADKDCLPRVMQSIGRRYVKWVNDIYGRSGTLWEGRYRASLVDSDGYLLRCQRYIELNPVRAGMVGEAQAYRWSSYTVNAGIERNQWLSPHEVYLGLGATKGKRVDAYKRLFAQRQDDSSWITSKALKGQPIGSDKFREDIERLLGVKFNREVTGRPPGENGL